MADANAMQVLQSIFDVRSCFTVVLIDNLLNKIAFKQPWLYFIKRIKPKEEFNETRIIINILTAYKIQIHSPIWLYH